MSIAIQDGLLPPLMMEVNASGGLANAAIISWAVCILGVILFDFSLLGECTSVGKQTRAVSVKFSLLCITIYSNT